MMGGETTPPREGTASSSSSYAGMNQIKFPWRATRGSAKRKTLTEAGIDTRGASKNKTPLKFMGQGRSQRQASIKTEREKDRQSNRCNNKRA